MAASIESLTSGELQKLLDGPAIAPPAGSISRLEDPPNMDTVCYLTLYLCLSCATLAVIMRIYTKQFLIHTIAYEDCECRKPIFAVSDTSDTITQTLVWLDW